MPFLKAADTFLVHDSPACAALVLSGLLTGGYTVLRAPLPKDVDLSDASARAAHAAAKRRALLVRSLVHSYATACLSPDVREYVQVGLRALGTATAASAVTVGAVVGGARLLGINSVRRGCLFHSNSVLALTLSTGIEPCKAADVRAFVRQQLTTAPGEPQKGPIEKPH